MRLPSLLPLLLLTALCLDGTLLLAAGQATDGGSTSGSTGGSGGGGGSGWKVRRLP
jgi:hypothetical protein